MNELPGEFGEVFIISLSGEIEIHCKDKGYEGEQEDAAGPAGGNVQGAIRQEAGGKLSNAATVGGDGFIKKIAQGI